MTAESMTAESMTAGTARMTAGKTGIELGLPAKMTAAQATAGKTAGTTAAPATAGNTAAPAAAGKTAAGKTAAGAAGKTAAPATAGTAGKTAAGNTAAPAMTAAGTAGKTAAGKVRAGPCCGARPRAAGGRLVAVPAKAGTETVQEGRETGSLLVLEPLDLRKTSSISTRRIPSRALCGNWVCRTLRSSYREEGKKNTHTCMPYSRVLIEDRSYFAEGLFFDLGSFVFRSNIIENSPNSDLKLRPGGSLLSWDAILQQELDWPLSVCVNVGAM
jgi:hypothetical protein